MGLFVIKKRGATYPVLTLPRKHTDKLPDLGTPRAPRGHLTLLRFPAGGPAPRAAAEAEDGDPAGAALHAAESLRKILAGTRRLLGLGKALPRQGSACLHQQKPHVPPFPSCSSAWPQCCTGWRCCGSEMQQHCHLEDKAPCRTGSSCLLFPLPCSPLPFQGRLNTNSERS